MLTQGMLMVIGGISGIVVTFIIFLIVILRGKKTTAVTNENKVEENVVAKQPNNDAPTEKQKAPVQATSLLEDDTTKPADKAVEETSLLDGNDQPNQKAVDSTVLLQKEERQNETQLYETELMKEKVK